MGAPVREDTENSKRILSVSASSEKEFDEFNEMVSLVRKMMKANRIDASNRYKVIMYVFERYLKNA